jgi:hypothetical protein
VRLSDESTAKFEIKLVNKQVQKLNKQKRLSNTLWQTTCIMNRTIPQETLKKPPWSLMTLKAGNWSIIDLYND